VIFPRKNRANHDPVAVFAMVENDVAHLLDIDRQLLASRSQSRKLTRARKLVAVACRHHGMSAADIATQAGCTRQAVHYQIRTFKPTDEERLVLKMARGL
jgi:hypothetical protein